MQAEQNAAASREVVTRWAERWADMLREIVIPGGYAAVLVLLFLITGMLVLRLLRELNYGDTPRIESHWGGFGGGLGGWQISRSLAYLLASLGFAVLTLTALGYAARDLRPVEAVTPRAPDAATAAPRTDAAATQKPDSGSSAGQPAAATTPNTAKPSADPPPPAAAPAGTANPATQKP